MNPEQRTKLLGALVAYYLTIRECMWDGPIPEEDFKTLASQYSRDSSTKEDLDKVRHWFNLEQINKDLAQ